MFTADGIGPGFEEHFDEDDWLGGGFILFNFHPYLGKWSNLTHIFQMGWNHQLVEHIAKMKVSFFLRKIEGFCSPGSKPNGTTAKTKSRNGHNIETNSQSSTIYSTSRVGKILLPGLPLKIPL